MTREKKQVLTVKNIRNVNMENILQSILRKRETTRSVLSKENNISLMTVKHVVDDLIEAKILVEKDSCNSDVGRNPKVLEIAEAVKEICHTPKTQEQVLKAVFDRYGLSMDFNQYVLVGSTIRSYLSWLLDRGEVAAEFTGNTLVWSA